LKAHPDFDGSNPWSWENVFLCGDVGPGSALEASGTSWYEKMYQSPLSYTSVELWREYQASIPVDSLRALAERQRDGHFGHLQVPGGKYSSVLKSLTTDRSIDIQPSVNMLAQKGIACILQAFVESHYGVNLSFQQMVNRELARRGSISDHLATIDLSEASNRIPWAWVEWVLEGTELLELIRVARCTMITMPWGETRALHMCSGMGNAFTFILMTAIHLAILEAVHEDRGREFNKLVLPGLTSWKNTTYFYGENERFVNASGDVLRHVAVEEALEQWEHETLPNISLPDWGVFGDDIICKGDIYLDVVRTLGLINARVNLEKSFRQGSFRESCGGDYWLGQNVRAVYAKSLATPHDRVSLLNRLIAWSAKHEIPLERTCRLLWSSCKKAVFFVPLHESDHAGLRVPEDYVRHYPLSRSVKDLQSDYQRPIRSYSALVPRARVKTLSGRQVNIYGLGILLSMIRGETASEFSKRDVTAASTPKSSSEPAHPDREEPNPDYRLVIRNDRAVEYEARWCWSACWDRTSSTLLDAHKMDWAISRNLGLNKP